MNQEFLEKMRLKRKEIAERESKKLFMVFYEVEPHKLLGG